MIQESEFMTQRILAIFIILLMLFGGLALPVNADDPDGGDGNEGNNSEFFVDGLSTLTLFEPIEANSTFDATWEVSVTISDQVGSDLLPYIELGLRAQIDINLGNSDGWINRTEIDLFIDIFYQARNWTNAESAGCCAFDYTPMIAANGSTINVHEPNIGSIEDENLTWGWIESANLVGITDSRTTRLLDLPRTGALIEEIPIRVILPSGWEYRYSAMREIISGEPGNFTVDRAASGAASNIRITIAENQAPNALGQRKSGGSMIPLNSVTVYFGECEDGGLDANEQWWTVSNNGTVVLTEFNETLNFIPEENGFIGGQVASVVMHCKDWFNSISTWYDNVVIDSVFPTWEASINFESPNGEITALDPDVDVFEVPSDSYISFSISADDPNSQLPTNIVLTSNKTEGYRHQANDQLEFNDRFSQSGEVNGMHLNFTERHLSREQTTWAIHLDVSDNAGNTQSRDWIILVLDGNGPTIVPDLYIDDVIISSENVVRNGDSVLFNFTPSYDDLDAITDTSWTITVDDIIIVENVDWSEIELFTIGPLATGTHDIILEAWDSSGNKGGLAFQLKSFPNFGVDISVETSSYAGKLVDGEIVVFMATLQNHGADPASGRICVGGECGAFIGIPGATPESPGYFSAEINTKIDGTLPLEVSFQWSSESANDEGTIILESGYIIEPAWQGPLQVVIGVFAILAGIVYAANRLWGADSLRP